VLIPSAQGPSVPVAAHFSALHHVDDAHGIDPAPRRALGSCSALADPTRFTILRGEGRWTSQQIAPRPSRCGPIAQKSGV